MQRRNWEVCWLEGQINAHGSTVPQASNGMFLSLLPRCAAEKIVECPLLCLARLAGVCAVEFGGSCFRVTSQDVLLRKLLNALS